MRTALTFALILLALGVAAPAAGGQARSASAVLGATNDEQGLDQFEERDGRTAPVTAAGREARATIEGGDPRRSSCPTHASPTARTAAPTSGTARGAARSPSIA